LDTGSQNVIKGCVLIENITASFQMDEILYELREHSAGLNCGIWDYSASFVARWVRTVIFPCTDPVDSGHAVWKLCANPATSLQPDLSKWLAAPVACRFAGRDDMIFPDRTKYVNMKCHFMKSYMQLLVHTCHRRGAPATTGMSALVVDPQWPMRLKEVSSGFICLPVFS
jgi:malate synthase